MDDLGAVGPDFTVAHGVWLDDDDMALLGSKGASVAHNPGSNMRLGSGLADVIGMIRRGVNVGIGTDGANRSEEHTSELQSLMRNSYAVFCLNNKKQTEKHTQ